jgi:hypothetical protein
MREVQEHLQSSERLGLRFWVLFTNAEISERLRKTAHVFYLSLFIQERQIPSLFLFKEKARLLGLVADYFLIRSNRFKSFLASFASG